MSFAPASFLERFALPLVAGGALHVDAPLGRRQISKLLEHAASSQAETEALDAARVEIASRWSCAPVDCALDEPSVKLLAALADVLYSLHPSARGVDRVTRFALVLLAELDAPQSDAEVFARHSLLHRLVVLSRDDVEVRNWVVTRRFEGREPPQRLLMWRELRRVSVERTPRVALALAEDPEKSLDGSFKQRIMRRLLELSPLTDLLSADRSALSFALSPSVRALRLPRVARAVATFYLSNEGSGALAAYTHLLAGHVTRAAVADPDLRLAIEFLCHLHLLSDEGPVLATGDPSPTPVAPRRAQPEYYALFAAAASRGIAWPADVKRDPRLFDRIQRYAARCRTWGSEGAARDFAAGLAFLPGK